MGVGDVDRRGGKGLGWGGDGGGGGGGIFVERGSADEFGGWKGGGDWGAKLSRAVGDFVGRRGRGDLAWRGGL